ncbi:response regulator transcription factor [Vallitalea okinawensis]|uniref:response regulator transcription factor n=1 Tax=Vallitalea okinawensis TaxID=2078660 RepID=UPI000CFCE203|nr:response regulator [Vallitalea okinawensis]
MYRLIIIDDEEEIRDGLSNYFPWDDMGYEVTAAFDNGIAAINYLNTNPVDVILSDIKMPMMDGIELASYVRDHYPSIKVIFLSGHKEFEYARQALQYGVREYIVKPTKFNELVSCFSKLKDELDQEQIVNETSEEESETIIEETYHDNIIKDINQYIHNNITTATLEEAALIVHMSPQHLSKFYAKYADENFSSYLLKVRMEKSKELLKDYKYKTYEISEMVGYQNAKNFTRAFKKYYSMTPRQFRLNKGLIK